MIARAILCVGRAGGFDLYDRFAPFRGKACPFGVGKLRSGFGTAGGRIRFLGTEWAPLVARYNRGCAPGASK